MSVQEISVEQRLIDNGYEDVVVFKDYSYDSALIGVSNNNRAIYDYEKMVEWLMEIEKWSYEEAVEWIDYNTLNAHYGNNEPIIMFPLET